MNAWIIVGIAATIIFSVGKKFSVKKLLISLIILFIFVIIDNYSLSEIIKLIENLLKVLIPNNPSLFNFLLINISSLVSTTYKILFTLSNFLDNIEILSKIWLKITKFINFISSFENIKNSLNDAFNYLTNFSKVINCINNIKITLNHLSNWQNFKILFFIIYDFLSNWDNIYILMCYLEDRISDFMDYIFGIFYKIFLSDIVDILIFHLIDIVLNTLKTYLQIKYILKFGFNNEEFNTFWLYKMILNTCVEINIYLCILVNMLSEFVTPNYPNLESFFNNLQKILIIIKLKLPIIVNNCYWYLMLILAIGQILYWPLDDMLKLLLILETIRINLDDLELYNRNNPNIYRIKIHNFLKNIWEIIKPVHALSIKIFSFLLLRFVNFYLMLGYDLRYFIYRYYHIWGFKCYLQLYLWMIIYLFS